MKLKNILKNWLKSIRSLIYEYIPDNASLILICTLVAIAHLLYKGYQFGIWNHSIQIPILKSYFHPELYPNDAMIATRSHFTTFYFLFLAVIERVFGHLEFIYFTAYLFTEIMFFIAIYHQSDRGAIPEIVQKIRSLIRSISRSKNAGIALHI